MNSVNATSATTTPQLKILLIEDNPVNQLVITSLLQQLGYSSQPANTPDRALDCLNQQSFDIIFLNMHMAAIDGVSMAQQIAAQSVAGRSPYLIALTGADYLKDSELYAEANIQDVVTIPLSPSKIAAALRQAEQSLQPSLRPPMPPCNLDDDTIPVLNLLVLDSIRELAGGAASDFLAELVDDFLADAPRSIERILAAVTKQDATALAQAAHSLRSSSANLGAERLSKLCEMLETAGREGMMPDLKWCQHATHSEFGSARSRLLAEIADLKSS